MAFSGFGGAPTAAPGGAPASTFSFGATGPAPAAGGFSFGGPAASFGSASPAPPAFGAAPAPPSFGGFGSPSPAPPAFGGFGGFGAPTPAAGGFGAPQQQQQQQQPPQVVAISGSTPYSSLPPDIKSAIDLIHEAIMKHKRAMINLRSMAPKPLLDSTAIVSATATGQNAVPYANLAATVRKLHQDTAALEQQMSLQQAVDASKKDYETLLEQSIMYGKWQVEALAERRGVHLRPTKDSAKTGDAVTSGGTASTDVTKSPGQQLQAVLDRQMALGDRLEWMPSPYLWHVLEDLEKRITHIKHHAWTVQQQIRSSLADANKPANVVSIAQSQHRALYNSVLPRVAHLHAQVEELRHRYRFYETGENVLDKADYEEKQREQRLNEQVQMNFVQASGSSKAVVPASGGTPAPSTPGPFGTPAPAFGGFGSTTTPAPAASFGFGPTPASSTPATAFGSTTPAFGSTTPAFGSTTPAPAFGTAQTPAPSAFGAPTPGAFGAAAPAPFSFAGTSASAGASTPKTSKNKSRSKSRSGR